MAPITRQVNKSALNKRLVWNRYALHTAGRYSFYLAMEKFDVDEILNKGLEDEDRLTKNELLIYSVAYFESLADIEGWDHFYTYSMRLYPSLLKILKLTGDIESLRILKDYENHFEKLGVKFAPEDIDQYLTTATNEYLESCPDWREQFSELGDNRWKLISSYLKLQGIELKT